MQKRIFTFLDCDPDADIAMPRENLGAGRLRSPKWAKKMQALKAVIPESVQQLARSLLKKNLG